MKNLVVKIRSEQEERVLLAFLNCLDYEFEQDHLSSVPAPEGHGIALTDGTKTLPHYATE
jgi:hypothetical protein